MSTAATTEALRRAAWQALATVRDPELDQPVTELGFVSELRVEGTAVAVRLRLPTYFCAPNFAYLMVADAHDALAALPGVGQVDVRLEDHFAADEINAGVAAGRGFADSFPGLADGGLAELRRTFLRKAHLACLERTCRRLVAEGWSVEGLVDLRLGDVPESADLDRLRRRRTALGLPSGTDDPLVVDDHGRPLTREEIPAYLRFATTVRVSVDGNAELCRGLLQTRYGRRPAAGGGRPQADHTPTAERGQRR